MLSHSLQKKCISSTEYFQLNCIHFPNVYVILVLQNNFDRCSSEKIVLASEYQHIVRAKEVQENA